MSQSFKYVSRPDLVSGLVRDSGDRMNESGAVSTLRDYTLGGKRKVKSYDSVY